VDDSKYQEASIDILKKILGVAEYMKNAAAKKSAAAPNKDNWKGGSDKPVKLTAGSIDFDNLARALKAFDKETQARGKAFVSFLSSFNAEFLNKLPKEVKNKDLANIIDAVGNNLEKLGKGLARSSGDFKKSEKSLPIITSIIKQMIDQLGTDMDEEKVKKAAKIAGIVSHLADGVGKLGKELFKSIAYYKVSGIFNAGRLVGRTIGRFVNEIYKAVDRTVTKEKAEAVTKMLSSLTGDIFSLGKRMRESVKDFIIAKPLVGIFTSFVRKLIRGLVKDLDTKTINQAEKVSKTLADLSGVIGRLGRTIAASFPVYIIARMAIPIIHGTIKGLIGIAKGIKKKDLETMEEAAPALKKFGMALLAVGALLALGAILFPVALVGMAFAAIGILALVGIAKLVGNNSEQMEEASKSIAYMSLSLLLFAASFAVSALIMTSVLGSNLAGGFMLLGALALTAIIYYYMGEDKVASRIGWGSLATLAMGVSLYIFAAAVTAAVKNIEKVGLEGLLMLWGTVAAAGLTFFIAGKLWKNILWGGIAISIMGTSLIIFGVALGLAAKPIKENKNLIWQLPVLIAAMGVVFAAAGIPVVAAFIMMGSLALGSMGVALIAIGLGLRSMPKIDKEQAKNVGVAIGGIVKGFGDGFKGLGIVDTLMLPIRIPLVALMGFALAGLGLGLGAYQRNVKGWSDSDTQGISTTITGLSKAFATAGSTEGMTKVFGFNVGRNDVERGIDATMKLGKNLDKLSQGIMAWKKMKLGPKDIDLITENISNIMSVIPGIFAQIGRKDKGMDAPGGKSKMFNMIADLIPWRKGDVERGIESTMEMGENLSKLATGILAWKPGGKKGLDLDVMMGKGWNEGDPAQPGSILFNIQSVLGIIPTAFAQIGAEDRRTEGPWPWSDGDVTNGMETSETMGKTLSDIAGGILAWKTGGDKGLTMEVMVGKTWVPGGEPESGSILGNIKAILNIIPSAFASIGKTDRATESIWPWSDGDVTKGAEIAANMGASLEGVTKSIQAWKGDNAITMTDVVGAGWVAGTEPKSGSILSNIKAVLNVIPTAFSSLAALNKDDAVTDGADVAEALAAPLEALGKVFKTFSSIQTPYTSGILIGGGISNLISYTKSSLTLFSDTDVAKLERLVSPMERITELFDKFSEKISKHVDAISKLPKAYIENFSIWARSIKTLSESHWDNIPANMGGYGTNGSSGGPSSPLTRADDAKKKENEEKNLSAKSIPELLAKVILGLAELNTKLEVPAGSSNATAGSILKELADKLPHLVVGNGGGLKVDVVGDRIGDF
jgi:hypothetical protein